MCTTSSEAEAGVPRVGAEVGSGDQLRLQGISSQAVPSHPCGAVRMRSPLGARTGPPSCLLPGLPSPPPAGQKQTPLFTTRHKESSTRSPQIVKSNKPNPAAFKARPQHRQGLLPAWVTRAGPALTAH